MPGLVLTGVGTGIVNAALGRIAVESVPPGRAGMGSGANNTARYIGGAAGAALIVSIASAGGGHALISGWNIAGARLGRAVRARSRDSSRAAGAGAATRLTARRSAWSLQPPPRGGARIHGR